MNIDHIPLASGLKNEVKVVLKSGKMPHASLLIGQNGGAQLSLAIAMSRGLLCINPSHGLACNSCPSCHKSEKLSHPDLNFTFPVPASVGTSDEGMDQWRKMILNNPFSGFSDWVECIEGENLNLNISAREVMRIESLLGRKSFEGRAKIFIVWYPEFLGGEGNKLLKSIEEPAPNTYIFLVASNMEKILPTIVSRCRIFKLSRPSFNLLGSWLKEYKNVPEEIAANAAAISEGIVNQAIKIIEGGHNTGVAEDFLNWSRISFESDPKKVLQFVDDLLNDGGKEKTRNLFRYGLFYFNQVLRVRNGLKLEGLNKESGESVIKMANFMDLESLQEISGYFDKWLVGIDRNASLKILLTHATIQSGRILRRALQRNRSRARVS